MKDKSYKITLAISIAIGAVTSVAMLFFNVYCSVMCAVLSAILVAIFIMFTNRRYQQISSLNNYLSMVCSGDYSLDINDNTEGELSILKNNLYKVVVMLQTSNNALKNDKKYLADSLADISHQLKTPLTSMTVMTDLIKQSPSYDENGQFVDIMEAQLEKMTWLIQTLLKLSKLDADTADFYMESISINEVVKKSIDPFAVMLDVRGIDIDMLGMNDFTFIGDKNWSVEAIQNIIKNCIEHTPDGGKLTISSIETNTFNQLTICDNGCGIHSEDLPHIFERFYHGKNSNSDSVGIGLALSKEILTKQRASIDVESTIDKGSKFIIKFYKSIV